jgi:hypothetical protein
MRLTPVLAILLLAATLAHAGVPALSDSFHLVYTPVKSGDYNIVRLCVGLSDTLYGYRSGSGNIWRSTDGGDTGTSVLTASLNVPGDMHVTARGWLLVSQAGKVNCYAGNGSGGLVLKDELVFECQGTNASHMWNPAEDSSGTVWIGEYGGASADTCSYIWRGDWTDGAYVWTLDNDPYDGGLIARHIHAMHVDPDTDWVYALVGDAGAGMTNPDN